MLPSGAAGVLLGAVNRENRKESAQFPKTVSSAENTSSVNMSIDMQSTTQLKAGSLAVQCAFDLGRTLLVRSSHSPLIAGEHMRNIYWQFCDSVYSF